MPWSFSLSPDTPTGEGCGYGWGSELPGCLLRILRWACQPRWFIVVSLYGYIIHAAQHVKRLSPARETCHNCTLGFSLSFEPNKGGHWGIFNLQECSAGHKDGAKLGERNVFLYRGEPL